MNFSRLSSPTNTSLPFMNSATASAGPGPWSLSTGCPLRFVSFDDKVASRRDQRRVGVQLRQEAVLSSKTRISMGTLQIATMAGDPRRGPFKILEGDDPHCQGREPGEVYADLQSRRLSQEGEPATGNPRGTLPWSPVASAPRNDGGAGGHGASDTSHPRQFDPAMGFSDRGSRQSAAILLG